MLYVAIEVAKFVTVGILIGICIGFWFAWDIDKERVQTNFKENWQPIIEEMIERYG